MKRVVVTGLGIVSSIGNNAAEVTQSLRDGKSGIEFSELIPNIAGLADDLCLAMQAESVLIDRIPGKSTVGIQIPNHNREGISLREILIEVPVVNGATKRGGAMVGLRHRF